MCNKNDISKNIAVIERTIDGESQVRDCILMMDTKLILEGIKNQLPM